MGVEPGLTEREAGKKGKPDPQIPHTYYFSFTCGRKLQMELGKDKKNNPLANWSEVGVEPGSTEMGKKADPH